MGSWLSSIIITLSQPSGQPSEKYNFEALTWLINFLASTFLLNYFA